MVQNPEDFCRRAGGKIVEGLLAAPWLAYWGEKNSWDCERCNEASKGILGCGFIKEYREVGPEANIRVVGTGLEQNWKPTVCPGYSSQLPAVIEARRNYSWAKLGQAIKDRYTGEELTPDCILAMDILNSAQNTVDVFDSNERIREMKSKH